jgi:hypothetical protein
MTKKASKINKTDKPDKPRGRPGKYTDTLCNSIIDVMTTTGELGTAAEALGIHRDTAYHWRDLGKAGDSKYHKFYCGVMAAKAKFVNTLVPKVADRRPDWLLSRLEPQLYPWEYVNPLVNVTTNVVQAPLTRQAALAELKVLALEDPEVAQLLLTSGVNTSEK